jgi:hypothetical protein
MIWIISLGNVLVFSTIDDREVIYPCLFCIQFFRQHISIALQCALTSAIKRKIALANDVFSRPPITIKFHDLHIGDIKRAMGEIGSYHKFLPFFGSYGVCVF